MAKKASLSLSINAIVVLILAIAMLGLALGFIKTMFGKVSGQVEAVVAQEPDPRPASIGELLTLSRDTIILRPTETAVIKFSAYNRGSKEFSDAAPTPGPAAILDTATTVSTCFSGILTYQDQIKKKVPAGGSINSQVQVKGKSSTDEAVCQICTVKLPQDTLTGACAELRIIIK